MQLDLEVFIPIRMVSPLAFPDLGIPAGMRDRKNNNQSVRFLYFVMYLVEGNLSNKMLLRSL